MPFSNLHQVAIGLALGLAGVAPLHAQGGGAGPIVTIAITPRTLRLGLDGDARLKVTARDSARHDVALGARKAAWSSSDSTIVSVHPTSGLVTANGVGSATITADIGGVKGSATVTVVAWKTVTAGNDFACGITTDGRAFCWGEQAFGSLGREGGGGSATPAAVTGRLVFSTVNSSLANSSCALTDGGKAYCWGFNNEGQLGDGTKDPSGGRGTPAEVAGGQQWIALSAGYSFACGVAADSVAHCWGASSFGIGNATATASLTPTPVDKVARFGSVSVGYSHACAVGGDQAAYCWGDNAEGDLGNGEMQKPRQTPVRVANVGGFTAVDAGFGFTCGVTAKHEAYCWGRNTSGQLGNGGYENSALPVPVKTAGEGFTAISAGASHACAVGADGGAYCWGSNQFGELGHDAADSSAVPVRVAEPARMGPRERPMTFASVTAGHYLSCGVTTAGRAYCWGKGDDGQLGVGGTSASRRPARVAPRP